MGAATRLPPLRPYRSRPGLVVVVMAAVSAPATRPSGRPQGPDLPGRRVSIRPQPTRASRGEVMALSPTWGGELAWAVAGGPTLERGGGGMARCTAAAALRLPLAPSVTGNVPRDSPPPPPLLGRGCVHRSERQRMPPWGVTSGFLAKNSDSVRPPPNLSDG